MCVSPLILRGEINFSTFPRKGEGEKNKISLLTKNRVEVQTTAKIWYNFVDFGEGVAIGLAGGTGPKEVLRVAEPELGSMKGVHHGRQENACGRYRNCWHSRNG